MFPEHLLGCENTIWLLSIYVPGIVLSSSINHGKLYESVLCHRWKTRKNRVYVTYSRLPRKQGLELGFAYISLPTEPEHLPLHWGALTAFGTTEMRDNHWPSISTLYNVCGVTKLKGALFSRSLPCWSKVVSLARWLLLGFTGGDLRFYKRHRIDREKVVVRCVVHSAGDAQPSLLLFLYLHSRPCSLQFFTTSFLRLALSHVCSQLIFSP
jgi:hypothetical protein